MSADPATAWADVQPGTGEAGHFAEHASSGTNDENEMGTYRVGYRLDDQGDVRLRGLAAVQDMPTADVGGPKAFHLLTLPCGFRPQETVMMNTAVGTGTGGFSSAVLNIEPDGQVTVIGDASLGTTVTAYIPLDGAKFELDGDPEAGECGDVGPPRSWYVDPEEGSDSAAGTETEPYRTIDKALDRVRPGDAIVLFGGLYDLDHTIQISEDGTETSPITLQAYEDEVPILDGLHIPEVSASQPVLDLQGVAHWSISGIRVTNGRGQGIQCSQCSNTTWSRVDVVENRGPGLVFNGEGTSNNLITDSDFHGNRDTQSDGENADGLSIGNGDGTGNVISGNRFWGNSDSGIDLWAFQSPIEVKGNWSFDNGNVEDGEDATTFDGDGKGFDLGGDDPQDEQAAVAHVVVENLAWGNGADGFDSVGNAGPLQLFHNTSYGNGENGFNIYAADETVTVPSDLRNNLSIADGNAPSIDPATDAGHTNAWTDSAVTADAADLASIDDSSATDARSSLGTLPDLEGFLSLITGSDLIDAGEAISGRTYEGSAPDYGAIEFTS